MPFEREPWAGTFGRIRLGNEKAVNEEAESRIRYNLCGWRILRGRWLCSGLIFP